VRERPSVPELDAGADRFDRRLTVLRRVAWGLIVPCLVIAAVVWNVPGSAVTSTVARGAIVYAVVLVVLRLAGKRTLSEMSTFDLVILLILSETVQPAMVGEDSSLTNAILLGSMWVWGS
jgi:hypothetical protein